MMRPPPWGGLEAICREAAYTLCREHRIVQGAIARHPPGLDGIEMRGADGFLPFPGRDAPVLVQLRPARLNVTRVIRGTRHDHRLFAVPCPVERKPGMGLW